MRVLMGRSTYHDLLSASTAVSLPPLSRGDRVVVSERNGIGFLSRLMALWRVGAVPCLIPPTLSVDKRRYCEDLVRTAPRVDNCREALILFTSSTSGNYPKGVRLSHENLVSHMDMLRRHVPDTLFGRDDRTFAFLPWSHCYGLMGECFSVMDRGARTNVLRGGDFRIDRFVMGMMTTSPTILFVVPRLLELLTRYPSWSWGGRSLRYVVSGGARLDPILADRFTRRHGIPILQGYGMTEMSPMVTLQNDLCIDQGTMTIGTGEVLPGVHVRIDGQTEEILVNGPNRFLGYLGEPDLPPGAWHATGDRGEWDGRTLRLLGRRNDRIKLPNGRFHDIQDVEQKILSANPQLRELCLWDTAEGLRGVVHDPRATDSTVILECSFTIGTARTRLSIPVRMLPHSFLTVEQGTLTLKGEKARSVVRKMYA